MEQGGFGTSPTSGSYCYPVLTPCESPAPLRLICPAKIRDADFKFLCKQTQNFFSFKFRHFPPLLCYQLSPPRSLSWRLGPKFFLSSASFSAFRRFTISAKIRLAASKSPAGISKEARCFRL